MRIKLITFANIIFLVLASFKDEALVKWPFCDFKEGGFESFYTELRRENKPIPETLFGCHIPMYEWWGDDLPDFKPNSERSFLLDLETEKAVATSFDGVSVGDRGFVWGWIREAIAEIDITKYSIIILDNEDMELFRVYFVAKQPEGIMNYIYLITSSIDHLLPEDLVSEETFLNLWKEKVQGKGFDRSWEDSSDDDSSDDNIDL